MYHDTPVYHEVRLEAQRLIWQVSKELNNLVGLPDRFLITSIIKPYTEALEWLAAVIHDDWGEGQFKSIVDEVQAMPRLVIDDSTVPWERFVIFLKNFADEKNISYEEIPPAKFPELPSRDILMENYKNLGLSCSLVSVKNGFLNRKMIWTIE
ncbi:MAG: hypothetical protein PHQ17_08850 [Methanobacterium sp.]|nr:hypothetical protein [Methanobacterium sp.]